jgi:putative ABC transport system permease protein
MRWRVGWHLFAYWVARDLFKNSLRTGLTILGAALGVAIALSMHLANQSAIRQFADNVRLIRGDAWLTLQARGGGELNETALQHLFPLWTQGVTFRALLEEQGLVTHTTQEAPLVIQLVGTDLTDLSNAFPDSPQGSWQAFQTQSPERLFLEAPQPGPQSTQPGAAIIGEELAATLGVHRGDRFNITVQDRVVSLSVVGVLRREALGKSFGGYLALLDIASLQPLLGLEGKLSRVLLFPSTTGPAGFRPEIGQDGQLRTWLTHHLPRHVEVITNDETVSRTNQMVASYRGNLMALSFIALLVSMLLIYNTFSISTLRRRTSLGVLRSLGAHTRDLATAFLLEALLIGLAGSVLGLVFGLMLAQGSVRGVSQTMQLLYTGQPLYGLSWHWSDLVFALVVGVGTSMAAAALPVWEALKVPPAQLNRADTGEHRLGTLAVPLGATGLAMMLVGGLLCGLPGVIWLGVPLYGFVAALLLNLGMILVIPLLLKHGLLMVQRTLGGWFGPAVRSGVGLLASQLTRSWIAVSSLAVTMGLLVSMTVMIASFQDAVIGWVNQSLRADVWIQSTLRQNAKQTLGLIRPELLAVMRGLPGVAAVDDFYDIQLTVEGGKYARLGAGDAAIIQRYGNLTFYEGGRHREVLGRLATTPNTALVSESFSQRFNKHLGDTVTLPTPSGPVTLTILGVYRDFASDLGYLIVNKRDFVRWFQENPTNSVALYLKPGFTPTQVKGELLKRLPGNARLSIQTNQELRDEVIRVFHQTFSITYGLQAITLFITLLTVGGALIMVTLLTMRDLATLRTLGASVPFLKRLLNVQALTLVSGGLLTGTLLGGLLALILIYVINKQSFGWSIGLVIPWLQLAQFVGVMLLTAPVGGRLAYVLALRPRLPRIMRELSRD